MTPERRAELMALCEHATPGEWRYEDGSILAPDERAVPLGYNNQCCVADVLRAEDAFAILAARAALPEALASLAQREEDLAQARAEIERLRYALKRIANDEVAGGWMDYAKRALGE